MKTTRGSAGTIIRATLVGLTSLTLGFMAPGATAMVLDTCSVHQGTWCLTHEGGFFPNQYCQDTGSSFSCATCCGSEPNDFCTSVGKQEAGFENCDPF
jgi:hypothetical protein